MKKTLAVLLLAIVLGLAALASTFTPARLSVPPLTERSLPPATPPDRMTLSALTTGAMHSRAAFAYRGGRFGEPRDFIMLAVLVRHPRGDLLFDTGFGREVDRQVQAMPWLMKALSTYTRGVPVADQLAAGGYDPARLAGVVLTHAHWDHVSGLPDLPGIPVWVGEEERAFIASGSRSSGLARGFGALPYRLYRFEGGHYLGFPRSHDVWGDGSIVLVPAPGHTPGSVIAFVALPSGKRYALLGDLVWQTEGIEIPAERPWLSRALVDTNRAEVRENIERMAAIHACFPEMRLVPAHDARAAAALPQFPAAER
ncbi:MAG TPA: MBL fold metallo-hydrolase [Anaeromyxobacteraceae bacterium]|nr:MBL fold metallo-hydrolase [Anaeromyxobacteraceae bacterium]